MFEKRLFYVMAALLCLVLAYHVGARNAGAQGAGTQEVAVLSGQIANGGTIPLPRYSDGMEAIESECVWTVSPQTLQVNDAMSNAYPIFERCSTLGRTVRLYWCQHGCGGGNCDPPPADCPGPQGGTANYMIIAIRATGPVSAQRQTFGQLKARYRPPAPTQAGR